MRDTGPGLDAAVTCKRTPARAIASRARMTVQSFVNRELLGWFLQFNGEFQIGLIDAKVFSVSSESRGDYLNTHFPVGNARCLRLAVIMGLKLEAFLLRLAMAINQMKNDFGIFHRFAICIPYHGHID